MYAFAALTAALRWQGTTVRLTEGEAWDADDPLVVARPDLFRPEPSVVRSTAGKPVRRTRSARPIEQATKAPGEKRTGKSRPA